MKPLPIEGEATKPGNGKRKKLAVATESGAIVPFEKSADMAWLQTIKELAPTIGIEGVRELMTMRREEQARLAEREFNAAMALAQAELEPVARKLMNEQTKKRYADLAAIAKAAMPIIHAHGFSAITSEFQSQKPDHLGVALKVGHRAGHSERYEFNIPWDGAGLKGNANKTPTHAYASTLSYGERYAKCKVFGIATEDDDGNAGSKGNDPTITNEQDDKIKTLIKETESDVHKFCRFFKIESTADLPLRRFDEAVGMLNEKKTNPL